MIRLALYLILITTTLYAQNISPGTGLELSNSKKLRYFVDKLSGEACSIGLNRDTIISHTIDILKKNKITPQKSFYGDVGQGQLYIAVNVTKNSFHVAISFLRPVIYYAGTKKYSTFATTALKDGAGTHGDSADYIIKAIDQYLNDFLIDLKKANKKNIKN